MRRLQETRQMRFEEVYDVPSVVLWQGRQPRLRQFQQPFPNLRFPFGGDRIAPRTIASARNIGSHGFMDGVFIEPLVTNQAGDDWFETFLAAALESVKMEIPAPRLSQCATMRVPEGYVSEASPSGMRAILLQFAMKLI